MIMLELYAVASVVVYLAVSWLLRDRD